MITETKNKHGVPVYALTEQPAGRSALEDAEAINLYAHVKHRWPEFGRLFFHVANESKSKPQYRKKLGEMGVTAGVADYILLMPMGGYNHLAIELKRERKRDSSVSAEQNDFLTQAIDVGGYACVCYGWRAAMHVIDLYMNYKLNTKNIKK